MQGPVEGDECDAVAPGERQQVRVGDKPLSVSGHVAQPPTRWAVNHARAGAWWMRESQASATRAFTSSSTRGRLSVLVEGAAFAGLEMDNVLGGYKVSADGAQLAARPFLVQILKGRREVIWPEAFRSAEPVLPVPEWSRRKP